MILNYPLSIFSFKSKNLGVSIEVPKISCDLVMELFDLFFELVEERFGFEFFILLFCFFTLSVFSWFSVPQILVYAFSDWFWVIKLLQLINVGI